MTYKNKTFRRAAAAAAAICLAFAFAFAEETGADRLGFGTSVTVSAADEYTIKIDSATLTYTKDAGGITITKADAGSETSIIIPNDIDNTAVTAIGANAFKDCSSLTSITLPDGVTAIGNGAFYACNALRSIDIPQSVASIGSRAFQFCDALTSVAIHSDIQNIEEHTFANCSSLKSINIPDSVTSIGAGAFSNCSALTDITIPPSVTSIGAWAFSDCSALKSIIIPPSVKSIGNHAFWLSSSFETVFLPVGISTEESSFPSSTAKIYYTKDSSTGYVTITDAEADRAISIEIPEDIGGAAVTAIGDNAFEKCSSLTSITLPDSLVSIGTYAFDSCTALQSIDIPQNVTSIGSYAFEYCESLTSVSIHSDIQKIEEYTFADCSSLTSVNMPDSLESIGEGAFYRCAFTSITIPQNVKTIGTFAFAYCDLTSINIPQNVTRIEKCTFAACTSLADITIPQGVTSIGENAFVDCFSLTGIAIPDSVTSIGEFAFERCTSLTGIAIPYSITSIGDGAFERCTSLKAVFLPDGISIEAGVTPSGTAKITYQKDGTSHVIITNADIGTQTSIAIPETICDKRVICIKGAFKDCSSLKSITLPSGLMEIQASAFEGCNSLESISIPVGVVRISSNAFKDCTSLASVDIPAYEIYIDDYTFANCTSLTSIDLPAGTRGIGSYAFSGCTSLADINLKCNGYINDNAFNGCTALTSVTIPSSVSELFSDIFANCTSLKTVYLPKVRMNGNITPEYTARIFYEKDAYGNVTVTDVEAGTQTSIVIPETIDGGKVTVIGDAAFGDCTSLTSITLPDSVNKIESNAFLNCTSLTTVNLPPSLTYISNYLFYNCTALESVELPDNITSIGSNAFSKCTSLTSIDIPANVTSIGKYAFNGCSSLESIAIPPNVNFIENNAFYGCTALKAVFVKEGLPLESASIPSDTAKIYYQVEDPGYLSIIKTRAGTRTSIESIEIPKAIGGCDVKAIKAEAFKDCGNIKNFILPDSITEIQNGAFQNCTSLESIVIPNGVTAIEKELFANCEKLGSVTLPESIISIGNSAFFNCVKLVSIKFPTDLENIGEYAFSGCTSLAAADLPGKLAVIGQNAFSGCESLTSVTIPESVEELSSGAFECCYNLADVTLPKGLKVLNKAVFHMTAITSIEIPNGVTQIGDSAFYECSRLESIELPPSVAYVDKWAFSKCSSLRNVFYSTGTDISDSNIPDTSARTKYEIRDGYAYILEVVPDSSNSLVVIPDYICGYEVMSTAEEYRQYVAETGHIHKGGTATCTDPALCDICGTSYTSTDPDNHDADTSTWEYDDTEHWNLCLRTGCEEHLNIAAHTFDNGTITTEPTETTDGVKTYTCEVCGYEKTETVPMLGHSPAAEWTYDSENHWKECTNEGCNEKLDTSAHDFDDGVITVKPTDTTDGVRTYTCKVCGYEKTETVSMLGHTSAAEWTYDSENHWKECTNEGCEEKLDTAAHDFDDGVVTAEPTTTSVGVRTYTCTVCGYEKTETIPKLEHTAAAEWKHDSELHWRDCATEGCGEKFDVAAHTFDDGVVTTEPTNTAVGVRTYTCKVCGYEKTETIPKLEHTAAAEWKHDSELHWRDCATEGCGEKFDVAAHTFDNGVVTTEPTKTSVGVRTYTCAVCGYEKTETVPMLEHTAAAEWKHDSELHWRDCATEGCGEKFDVAAHTFDDGVVTAEPTETAMGVLTYTCTVCGYEKTESIDKLPSKPAAVIYPIAISGDVTVDKPSAAAGETVTVSAPFGYDIIITAPNGKVIAKISEKGSFTMPASGVRITAVRSEIFAHMSNAWKHSYVYSYDSDMNRIKVNSDIRKGVITIDLGADHAGRSFTLYSGRRSTSKKIISGVLDENGRYIFSAEEGKNYTLVVE